LDERALKGVLLLFAITLLWGTSFPVIKVVMSGVSPYAYTGLRALVSTLALAPLLIVDVKNRGFDRQGLRFGLLSGVMYSFGIFFQGWGTAYTTASNSAFLTSTSVVMVIAIEALISRGLDWGVLAAGIGSVAGVYLISGGHSSISVGDALVLISAAFWACQILIVSYTRFSSYVQFAWATLATPSAFLMPALKEGIPRVSLEEILWITYLGAVVGSLSTLGQVVGQRRVSASVSAVIYQMEPLFAYLLSYAFLGESFDAKRGMGAALILSSSLYASYLRVARGGRGQ